MIMKICAIITTMISAIIVINIMLINIVLIIVIGVIVTIIMNIFMFIDSISRTVFLIVVVAITSITIGVLNMLL